MVREVVEKIPKPAAIYFAKPEFRALLCEEIGTYDLIIEDLIFSAEKKTNLCFAQDIWLEPEIIPFQSISEAVKILRQRAKLWYLHPVSHIRRSRLIEDQLRKYPSLIQPFPLQSELPTLGAFSLLDQNTLVLSSKRLKKWPQGECLFIEDKVNPPNRAYLKLWEALSYLSQYPKSGDLALDLGASPGGWTYVMQSFGTKVTAVDKAPLDPKIVALPGVSFLNQSAFALDPKSLNQSFDWVLSDIACYPERAYALISNWIESGKAKQMIFTIKLQGEIDLKLLKQFHDIPNSSVFHMFYNKHEVTFFHPKIPN